MNANLMKKQQNKKVFDEKTWVLLRGYCIRNQRHQAEELILTAARLVLSELSDKDFVDLREYVKIENKSYTVTCPKCNQILELDFDEIKGAENEG